MNVQTATKVKVVARPKELVFKTPYEKAFGAYIVLTGLIVFFIPADILKSHAWAVEFTDYMAGWVPQIDLITGLGVRPDLGRFYYSVVWAMSPLLFVLCVLMGLDRRQRTYPFWNLPIHKAIPLALTLSVIVYASTQGYWMTNTNNGVLRFLVGNRLGMAYVGNITYVAAPVMFAAGFFNVVAGWMSGAIPRHIRRQAAGER
jgi:hypothetical protein